MSKEFKILAIDGGGIKGLYSAIVLKHIEQRLGGPLADHFDLICGTSTGGLIALALSLKRPASDIADFYAHKGKSIFPYTSRYNRSLAFFKQVLWKSKYSDKALRGCLEDFLGRDTTMKDAIAYLCIPSFNLTTGQPTVFKKPFKEYYRDATIKMVDVALATSAAPTFSPIAKLDYPDLKGLFVDGGVWANSPALCGILEALDHFVGQEKPYGSYRVLSIASIAAPNGWGLDNKRRLPFLKWGNRLFQTSLDGQSYFSNLFAEKIVATTSPPGKYVRIPSPLQLSKEHLKDLDMDKAGQVSIDTLISLGNTQGTLYTTTPEYRQHLEPFFTPCFSNH